MRIVPPRHAATLRPRPAPVPLGLRPRRKSRRMNGPVVTHDYTDWTGAAPAPPVAAAGPDRRCQIGRFPVLLYDFLEAAEENAGAAWAPHGRAFLVRDRAAFLAALARHGGIGCGAGIASVQRQLNLYGFKRLAAPGPDRGGYYHERFLRGRPDLLAGIRRIERKGTGVRPAPNPEAEPDFWRAFPWMTEADGKPKAAAAPEDEEEAPVEPSRGDDTSSDGSATPVSESSGDEAPREDDDDSLDDDSLDDSFAKGDDDVDMEDDLDIAADGLLIVGCEEAYLGLDLSQWHSDPAFSPAAVSVETDSFDDGPARTPDLYIDMAGM